MSTIKISALPSGNPAQLGDEIPIARGGTSYKITAGSITDLAGNVSGPASSVNNQIALFAGTAGDSIQAASTTGLLKASSGVIAAAVLGVDYGNVSGADTISTDNAIVRFDGTSGKLIQKSTAGVTDAGFLTANGLTFPAAQVSSADVNTLDDYEEGTWTPSYQSTDIINGDITITYGANSRIGYYRKIGAVVFFSLRLQTNNVTVVSGANELYISGFPFANLGSSFATTAIQIPYVFGWGSNGPSLITIVTSGIEAGLSYRATSNSLSTTLLYGTDFLTGTNTGRNFILVTGCYLTST